MQKLRVLQIVAGLDIGGLSGGAESFAVRLAQHLDPTRFQSAIFALQWYETPLAQQWGTQLRNQGIAVFGQQNQFSAIRPAIWPALYRNFSACIDEFQPDLINSHSERADLLNIIAKYFHRHHPQSVQTIHIDQPWKTQPAFGYLFQYWIAPRAFAAHVAVSETIRQQAERRLQRWGGNKRVHLIYNAISPQWFAAPSAKRASSVLPASLPLDCPRIGIIGRLTEQKGHAILFQALKHLLPTCTAHLLIVGSGALEEQLRSRAEQLGIAQFVHFLGQRTDIVEILAELDLLVSASLWEGFPTILLEAMAQAVPVVATDVAGSKELVKTGETGILVAANAPMELAEAIRALLENPKKAEQMAHNAQHFASRFTIDKTAEQYAILYQEITQG